MGEEQSKIDEVGWQQQWADARLFEAEISEGKPAFYCLEMYPYPSGKMHMGHVRNYSIGDAVARYKRMMGFDVLYPMGFDSFGMPAENAAISEGGHPHDITERNMASITEQIKRMGFSYDWRRTLKSHDPKYYKWNQWFFTKFLENGLARREFAPVNWCGPCNTVLANEQVKAGRCWRCNGPVEQKGMSQWFLDTPTYAQELYDGLDTIAFPDHVKSLQRDWLGRSEGANITFDVVGQDSSIEVFTTRPDTLFGATFVTLAPEHPLSASLVQGTAAESAWSALHDEVASLEARLVAATALVDLADAGVVADGDAERALLALQLDLYHHHLALGRRARDRRLCLLLLLRRRALRYRVVSLDVAGLAPPEDAALGRRLGRGLRAAGLLLGLRHSVLATRDGVRVACALEAKQS